MFFVISTYMAKKMSKVFHKKFGKRVRELRKERGMTQEQLSLEILADNSYIANIENAHRDIPLSRIRLIAKALGVEPYELLKF
ncbi:TPA: XRE family transcriptional regulator [Candidatus Gastranaerophilales bacterium HUM_6]|nr:transcriptional regulator XRE family [Fusobacterium sp. CAG:815]DAA88788.1 MAG TPA: XRE family transcriptional regulator [Candidatus Gastranaerophilales bacterium HUM_6]DAA92225.1 MAG TPA: XRE family transcriptional regulator [Candidatus Gastranaerophilales bacterium HUM_7]DAB03613.1 MAG TPA: XRE family transcriptional regulator [Candidatus Gastranaerophilales bacterium HUM_12]DAB08387.1 MAG TPA: XRE family transcriptional regulator [Candidatus Gastranaerophilales bacterium HUM_14]